MTDETLRNALLATIPLELQHGLLTPQDAAHAQSATRYLRAHIAAIEAGCLAWRRAVIIAEGMRSGGGILLASPPFPPDAMLAMVDRARNALAKQAALANQVAIAAGETPT